MNTMNITLKATFALGAAGLSLLALTGQVSAQTPADPNLSRVFSTITDGGTGPNTPSITAGQAIGFDPLGGNGKLGLSATQPTAQSLYEAFRFTSSAAGTFSTLVAGSTVQVGSFAQDSNVNTTPAGTTPPFNMYVSLYAFNPNAAVGTVPATGANLFGGEQKITVTSGGAIYFTNDFTTTGDITAGQSYVLGFTTLNSDTQDFGQLGTTLARNNGIAAADQTFDNTKFATQVDDQGNPAGGVFTNPGGNNTFGFTLSSAAAPAAVPEASSLVSTALLLSLGGAFLAFKRRASFAK